MLVLIEAGQIILRDVLVQVVLEAVVFNFGVGWLRDVLNLVEILSGGGFDTFALGELLA